MYMYMLFFQCGVHKSSESKPDYGAEKCNGMPIDEEKGENKSDSGTPNEAVEESEESKYSSVAIAPLETQPPPSVDQRVQYQEIDVKKTKVS